MKRLIFIILILSMTILGYGQIPHEIGPRIPSFNDSNFKYLDTIKEKKDVFIDSIINSYNEQVDTFSYCEIYNELKFTFPDDSIFIFRENLKTGQLINSKKYGFWHVNIYDFVGGSRGTSRFKTRRVKFYFNDELLFDASNMGYVISKNIDLESNTAEIKFIYKKHGLTKTLLLTIKKNVSSDDYTCSITSIDGEEIIKVSSKYLDQELILLFAGNYDRKIFG